MKVLVIGSGGREHALVWKLLQSPKVDTLFVAPGNDGMDERAVRVPLNVTQVEELTAWAQAHAIDLTVVGPEAPLALGLVDKFQAVGLKVFGPTKAAAELEGSKTFAKTLMHKHGIPTAAYGTFTEPALAKAYVHELGVPCVVKADGLAAGKGVVICHTLSDALTAIDEMLLGSAFGEAGHRVVIEEFLEGEEVSILAFCDGKTVLPMVSAQDHKRIFDNDQGPNTGGMGAYSPAPAYTVDASLAPFVESEILQKTVKAMAYEGRPFTGVLYAGLMLTASGPKVLEYNARFGDPETQPVLMRMDSDLVDVIEMVVEGSLDKATVRWKDEAAVCVVMASKGYPESSSSGDVIVGIDKAEQTGAVVFHSGTRKRDDGAWVTAGGRVLGVTALGTSIEGAIANAYRAVDEITFPGAQVRRDIGQKALKYENR